MAKRNKKSSVKTEMVQEAAAVVTEAMNFSDPVVTEALTEIADEPKLIVAEGELGEMIATVASTESEAMIAEITSELGVRAMFEGEKNPNNANIHKTLAKCTKALVRRHVANLFIAAQISPKFVNRVLQDGSKYNVYAIQKLTDFADGLVGAGMHNAINIACMKSLFACRAAGIAFTGKLAKAAASDKIKIAEAINKHLVRHTVSASTAPTQSSSTMMALQTLGVVKIDGSRKNPTYSVVDGPLTRRLEALCAGVEIEEEAEAA